MLTRRSFFSFLASIPFIGYVFAKQEIIERTPPKLVSDGWMSYRKYKIRFTGWKHSQRNDLLAAQWLGYPLITLPKIQGHPVIYDDELPYLVAPCPGKPAAFIRGDSFNIEPRHGETAIMWRDADELKERSMKKGGRRLIRMIDAVLDSGKRGLKVGEWNEFLRNKGLVPLPQTEEEANADVRRPMQGLRIRSRILV